MSSCVKHTSTLTSNAVIKFDVIKSVYGISSVDSFKRTGIFKCEISGLYLLTATILSPSSFARFLMVKNGVALERVFFQIYQPGSSDYQTGTGILAINLRVGDTLRIQTGTSMQVNGESDLSCITIVKFK